MIKMNNYNCSKSNKAIADTLDQMQKLENCGRGIDCVRTLIIYLNKGDFNGACAVARNEWDKISSYPEISKFLIKQGLFIPIKL